MSPIGQRFQEHRFIFFPGHHGEFPLPRQLELQREEGGPVLLFCSCNGHFLSAFDMALVSPICRGRFSNAETEDEARFPPLQLVWAGPSFAGFFSLDFSLDWPQSPLTTSLAEGERRGALLLLLFPYRPKCSFFLLLLPEAASDAPKPYATTAMPPSPHSLETQEEEAHTQKRHHFAHSLSWEDEDSALEGEAQAKPPKKGRVPSSSSSSPIRTHTTGLMPKEEEGAPFPSPPPPPSLMT